MGAQLGHALVQVGGWQPLVDFYPRMPAIVMAAALPDSMRAHAERAIAALMRAPTASMARARRKRFPEYHDRSVAMLEKAGLPASMADHLVIMDVFQNLVAMADRVGLVHSSRMSANIHGMCSSLAVWGDRSVDGVMRHARNFDFPGAGIWDHAPTVVFCTPDKGVPYGYVSTRGADVPGVTAFNEAGLTLSAHTRFHRDVSFRQAAVVDVGHDIIRRAETVAEALRVAAEHPAASTWGFLVSSAKERRAVLIETTAAGVEGLFSDAQGTHLACTNRYRCDTFHAAQVGVSPAFVADSDVRFRRMEAAAARGLSVPLDTPDLQRLMGEIEDPDAVDAVSGVLRVIGNTVASPLTVQSVVSEPEAARIHVSIGTAPTGFGPWVTVAWDWSQPTGVREIDRETALANGAPSSAPPSEHVEAYRAYVDVTRAHLLRAPRSELLAEVELLAARWPREPHFRFLAAIATAQRGALPEALEHLRAALALERGAFRRAQYLLWRARVFDALGNRGSASADRAAIAELSDPRVVDFKRAARSDARRRYTPRRLASTAINLMLVDAE